MSERPTPETDAAELIYDGNLSSGYADVDVCRKLERERDEARAVADNLVEYAHECLTKLESWGKGYPRYEAEMQTIREAIAAYEKMEAAK